MAGIRAIKMGKRFYPIAVVNQVQIWSSQGKSWVEIAKELNITEKEVAEILRQK